jgi:hypothetical protein
LEQSFGSPIPSSVPFEPPKSLSSSANLILCQR